MEIFTKSLKLGHIPEIWRSLRVTFIAKIERTVTLQQRITGLYFILYFLLNAMERPLDSYGISTETITHGVDLQELTCLQKRPSMK